MSFANTPGAHGVHLRADFASVPHVVWRPSRGDGRPAFVYDFKTEDDSAVTGDDYTAKNGTVTFSSGENEKEVGVDSLTDTVSEDDETFKLKLDNQTWLGRYHGDDVAGACWFGVLPIHPLCGSTLYRYVCSHVRFEYFAHVPA